MNGTNNPQYGATEDDCNNQCQSDIQQDCTAITYVKDPCDVCQPDFYNVWVGGLVGHWKLNEGTGTPAGSGSTAGSITVV